MFSYCLCSWNDLPFLKILYSSLQKYAKIPHEIIIHDNGSEDGTEQWLKKNNIKYSRSSKNEGVAAVNYAVQQAKYPYIVDINADMFILPLSDVEIFKQIQRFKKQKIDKFTISSTLIEPYGNNPAYTTAYFGHTPETFNEEALVKDYLFNPKKYEKPNIIQYSHPITMPKTLWDEFGGVDINYLYGIATDHDIPASAYNAGCRNFIMLGKSRVYHFISQTIKKLPNDRPNNHDVFCKKWGITIEEFRSKMGIAEIYKSVPNDIELWKQDSELQLKASSGG